MEAQEKRGAEPYYKIGSLVKGIKVIELLADHGPLSVSDVARRLNQDRSASHRFLATLRDEGYVKQDLQGRYSLSLKIFGLGSKVVNRMEIRALARPLMLSLMERHKETFNLACLDEGNVVVIEMVKSLLPLKFELPLGSRGPAHASALGKAMLAFSPERVLENYFTNRILVKQTQRTMATKEELIGEFQRIKQRGYSLDNEEWASGIRCVAVAVFDHNDMPSFALSASGPVQRMSEKAIKALSRDLKEAANELSSSIGAGSL